MQRQEGRVRVESDVVFGRGGGRELHCNVYWPPEPGEERPAALLVHGGGWAGGDRSQLHGYGILLGRLGLVCVACEYRLSGEAKWPAQIHDVKAALRWMRAERKALGIDADRIAVSGNSAGGHLSLMLAATPGAPEFEGEGGQPEVGTEVAAAIAFYPPTNLEPGVGAAGGAIAELFETGVEAPTVRGASPLHYARRDFPPTLLIHGNRDELVSQHESLRMYRALAECGAPVELHLYNGAPHGFDAERDLGRQCADVMALFLDRHMVAPRPVAIPTAAG